MKIRHIHVFFAIIIILGGGIWVSNELGLFATAGRGSTSVTGSGRGRQVYSLSSDASIETSSINMNSEIQSLDKLSGQVHDIAEIRGSFTLEEVEQLYGVPPEAIIEGFNLSKDTNPAIFRLNNLKEIYHPVELEGEIYEVETDTVKTFVSLYTGMPYISEETFYLPKHAVDYLINRNKLSGEKKDYWENHTFDLILIKSDSSDKFNEEKNITDYPEEETIKIEEFTKNTSIAGRTTIAELLAMGIDEESFKKLTGLEIPEQKNISVRDYAVSNGIDFGEIRGKLETFLITGN